LRGRRQALRRAFRKLPSRAAGLRLGSPPERPQSIGRLLAPRKKIRYTYIVETKIYELIQEKLLAIEKEHNVAMLYAVESGSRAWGFESPDSDYDVRFVYVHTKNWYLNILPKKDVIEYPIIDEFDCSGWDLRKTLFLLHKSNPALFEWLKSPLVYYKDTYFYALMERLSKEYFSPLSSAYHYLHMARGSYRELSQAREVKIKKYFYALRPILACMWIERRKETPPMEFETLLKQIEEKELLDAIAELLHKKKSGAEARIEPTIKILNDFIEASLGYFEKTISTFDPRKKPRPGLLEEGFIKILDYIESARLLPTATTQNTGPAPQPPIAPP
jgi:predicted nucleotidyltransferase